MLAKIYYSKRDPRIYFDTDQTRFYYLCSSENTEITSDNVIAEEDEGGNGKSGEQDTNDQLPDYVEEEESRQGDHSGMDCIN